MPFEQRMLGQVVLTLSKNRIEMLCHGRDHSFLLMAQYGAKSFEKNNTSVGPPGECRYIKKCVIISSIIFYFGLFKSDELADSYGHS